MPALPQFSRTDPALETRKALWGAGFRPVPVLTGQKRPHGLGWQDIARRDPPPCTLAASHPASGSTGVLCDGLRAIDIDIEDTALADRIEADARELLGLAPVRYREGSGKRALFYRAAEGEPGKLQITGSAGKLEVLGRGQQIVVSGTHPAGMPYEWRDPDGVPLDGLHVVPHENLVAITEGDLGEFLALMRPIIGAPAGGPPEPPLPPAAAMPAPANDQASQRVRAAAQKALTEECARVAGAGQGTRNDTLNGTAFRLGRFVAAGGLYRTEAEAALEQACSQNGLWGEDGPNACRATIKSGLESGISAGPVTLGERERANDSAPMLDPSPLLAGRQGAPSPAPQGVARGRIIDLSRDEDFVPRPELVRDTIPEVGVGFLGGQSGAFKTFAAIELGACLMTGEPFAGRKIERTGGVIYVAFEGEGTIAGRLKARRSKMADPSQELPFLMLEGFGAISKPEDFAALASTLREAAGLMLDRWGTPLVAIIIDTVAASGMIPEDKENDPGAWQRVFDGLNPIAQEHATAVILIHHFGKSAEAGLRGSSNNRAGADFVLAMTCERDELTGTTANHRLALSKYRDGPEGVIGCVTSEAVQIGTRADGSPVTSLVLHFDTDTKIVTSFRQRRPNRRDRAFAEALTAALIDASELVHVHGQSTAPRVTATRLERVREEFGRRYVTSATDEKKKADTIRKQFSAAIDRASAARQIFAGSWGGSEWVWSAEAGGDDAE